MDQRRKKVLRWRAKNKFGSIWTPPLDHLSVKKKTTTVKNVQDVCYNYTAFNTLVHKGGGPIGHIILLFASPAVKTCKMFLPLFLVNFLTIGYASLGEKKMIPAASFLR